MRHFIFFLLTIGTFALQLIGCASTPKNQAKKSSLSKVFVTNTSRVDVLPPDSILEEIDDYFLFEGTYGGKTLTATVYLTLNQNEISAVLLNNFGIEMGTINYDGTSAEVQSSLFPKKLKPEYIILDLQNAFASPENLKNHYAKYGFDFCELDAGEQKTERQLLKKKEIIERIFIDKTENIIKIDNILRGYEYRFTKIIDE
ncbi:DUF3261 domain-containing protein [Treponema zioleckii]|uniref:DUF3261 domain-containing protein n=1 Tax=Treponema zioleckii TaxID=331680 RepID=UPI00168A9CD3|nr:DUF3261 domain-containing protein [Treponema zioleckii]